MNYYKWIAAIILIVGIFAAAYFAIVSYGSAKYQAGIDAQIAKQSEADKKADSEAVEKLREKLSVITREKEEWREKADKLAAIGPEVIYEEVEKIVKVESCTNRGDDFVRLWNERYERFLLGVSIISE